jgi:hypothetical protein
MFDWTQRIERDADTIREIIMDEHKYGCGFHSDKDFTKIREILKGLVYDVQSTEYHNNDMKVDRWK